MATDEIDRSDMGTIRTFLATASEEQFVDFLESYSYGAVADRLIDAMSDEARRAFFTDMQRQYPEYWRQKP